jgi:hypothetical protein
MERSYKLILKNPKKYYVEIWSDRSTDWSHAPDEDFLDSVSLWLSENELGFRTSYNGFRLAGPEALTAFYLKYSND